MEYPKAFLKSEERPLLCDSSKNRSSEKCSCELSRTIWKTRRSTSSGRAGMRVAGLHSGFADMSAEVSVAESREKEGQSCHSPQWTTARDGPQRSFGRPNDIVERRVGVAPCSSIDTLPAMKLFILCSKSTRFSSVEVLLRWITRKIEFARLRADSNA